MLFLYYEQKRIGDQYWNIHYILYHTLIDHGKIKMSGYWKILICNYCKQTCMYKILLFLFFTNVILWKNKCSLCKLIICLILTVYFGDFPLDLKTAIVLPFYLFALLLCGIELVQERIRNWFFYTFSRKTNC